MRRFMVSLGLLLIAVACAGSMMRTAAYVTHGGWNEPIRHVGWTGNTYGRRAVAFIVVGVLAIVGVIRALAKHRRGP